MKKDKIKNAFLVILTLVLTATIAAAVTYAMRDKAHLQTVENTFTNGNVTIALFESEWDGVTGPNDSGAYVPSDSKDLGMNLALHYTQGEYIPKNPLVANISDPDATGLTTDDLKAWIGIKAEFYTIVEEMDEEGNFTNNVYEYTGRQFDEYIAGLYVSGQNRSKVKADYDNLSYAYVNGYWMGNDDWTEFYYRLVSYNKQSTSELFHWLKPVVLDTTTDADGEKMYIIPVFENGVRRDILSYSMPDFDVDLKAYAIQYQMSDGREDFDEANVKEKLHVLMNYQANMNNGG